MSRRLRKEPRVPTPRSVFRIARAPTPRLSAPRASLQNRVESVILAPGEDVQWIWTHGADGSYVSGYTIRLRIARRSPVRSSSRTAAAQRKKSGG